MCTYCTALYFHKLIYVFSINNIDAIFGFQKRLSFIQNRNEGGQPIAHAVGLCELVLDILAVISVSARQMYFRVSQNNRCF
jgi:hypothetical protein